VAINLAATPNRRSGAVGGKPMPATSASAATLAVVDVAATEWLAASWMPRRRPSFPTRTSPRVEELATLRFVEERSNVIFIGQPGVGKTMLAVALGLEAIDAGHRVYYTTAAELVARTSKAAAEGRLGGDDALLGRPGRSHSR
jgi:hypothetical protein